jgi:hypothetical protein
MSREQAKRALEQLKQSGGTSAAHQYDRDGIKGTSLENAPDMQASFERSAAGTPHDTKQQGSQDQAFQPQPAPSPTPPASVSKDVDRIAHNERAQQLYEAQKARQEAADRERMKDGKDHDPGSEL